MKSISQGTFKKLCTKKQWDAYVEGLISEAADRDEYFKIGDRPAFVAGGEEGGSSHPVLGWDGHYWSELE